VKRLKQEKKKRKKSRTGLVFVHGELVDFTTHVIKVKSAEKEGCFRKSYYCDERL